MSLTAAEIVEYLAREGALVAPDESSWPTVEEGADLRPVDWRGLRFGTKAKPSKWEPDLDEPFLRQLEEIAGGGEAAVSWEVGDMLPDVCAWYQPIHFHGPDWGIYIREDCLLRIARGISAFLSNRVQPIRISGRKPLCELGKKLILAAFSTLFLHEAYHHKTESFAIRLHVVEGRACYVDYFRNVYNPLRASRSNDLHEEALANAESYRRLSEPAYRGWLADPDHDVYEATLAYLTWRFPRDPPGYNQAPHFLNRESFDRCEGLLLSQVQERTLTPYRSGDEWRLAPRINQSFYSLHSNIWTIVSPGAQSILPTLAAGAT